MSNYPAFPTFRKVVPADKAMHERYYRHYEPYCDFSFNDLMVWMDYSNDLCASFDSDNLVIRFSNPLNNNKLTYCMLGSHDCGRTVKKIFKLQENLGLPLGVKMVPEVVVRNLGDAKEELSIREDVNNKDYIFNVPETHSLDGGRFADLRHKINYFTKHNPTSQVRELDLGNTQVRLLLSENMRKWFKKMPTGTNRGRLEGEMVQRHIERACELSPYCLGIFDGDMLIAFSIFHLPPQQGFAIGNHIKYDPTYRYLFDFTFWATASWLDSHAIKYVNGEQDLGLEGMRKHKEEMRPCGFLRRYSLTPSSVNRSHVADNHVPKVTPISTQALVAHVDRGEPLN